MPTISRSLAALALIASLSQPALAQADREVAGLRAEMSELLERLIRAEEENARLLREHTDKTIAALDQHRRDQRRALEEIARAIEELERTVARSR